MSSSGTLGTGGGGGGGGGGVGGGDGMARTVSQNGMSTSSTERFESTLSYYFDMCTFIYVCVHVYDLFIYSFIYSFFHLFIHLFINLFI